MDEWIDSIQLCCWISTTRLKRTQNEADHGAEVPSPTAQVEKRESWV